MKNRNKVLAVVVTYNRLNCLKRCYQGLLDQTNKHFDILIVNNGSTDGTREWLETLPDTVIQIHQENLGGAGGFYAGQKYGYDNNYEWIWMMDDDGLPDQHQLEELMKAAHETNEAIITPIVLNVDNPEEEAFYPGSKLNLPENTDTSYNKRYVCPFNGVVFHRRVLDKIGLIKREMFIWGDEREYALRWRKAGFHELAALKAVHYHPTIKTVRVQVFPFCSKYCISLKPAHLSKYYYRNNGFINRSHSTWKVIIIEGAFYVFYFLRKGKLREMCKYIKHYSKGVCGKF